MTRREVERAFAELGGRETLSPAEGRVVESVADAIVRCVLATPLDALQEARDGRTVDAAARVLPVAAVDGALGADGQASSD